MASFTPRPFKFKEKCPPWAVEQMLTICSRENLFPLTVLEARFFETRFVGRPACSLITTRTELTGCPGELLLLFRLLVSCVLGTVLISLFRVSGLFTWTYFSYPEYGASQFPLNIGTNILHHGYTNLGLSVARATQFGTMSPNICASLLSTRKCGVTRRSLFLTLDSAVWNLLSVTLLAPRILR